MNTTELGVYILGATSLVLLAAAGLLSGDPVVTATVLLSAGLSYLAQVLSATAVIYRNAGRVAPPITDLATGIAALSVLSWAVGFIFFVWSSI